VLEEGSLSGCNVLEVFVRKEDYEYLYASAPILYLFSIVSITNLPPLLQPNKRQLSLSLSNGRPCESSRENINGRPTFLTPYSEPETHPFPNSYASSVSAPSAASSKRASPSPVSVPSIRSSPPATRSHLSGPGNGTFGIRCWPSLFLSFFVCRSVTGS